MNTNASAAGAPSSPFLDPAPMADPDATIARMRGDDPVHCIAELGFRSVKASSHDADRDPTRGDTAVTHRDVSREQTRCRRWNLRFTAP